MRSSNGGARFLPAPLREALSIRTTMSPLERIRARLSAEGYFGFQLIAGAMTIVCAAALFGILAHNVADGEPLTILDAKIATWFHTNGITPLTTAMLLVSDL